jgi:lipoyl(octanoyl) transferase
MALDEALLEAMPRLGRPMLRFYGWTERAASFGYFQKYADVERLTPLRPLVRRPTGGGLVPHDADWTYSLAIPTNDEWYALTATGSYRRVHEWVRDAFAKMSVSAELAPEARKAGPGECFAGHERFDVLWHGRKIAGAAQRRTRNGLLIQGSVQPPPLGLPRADWERAMIAAGSENKIEWTEFHPDAALREAVAHSVAEKFGQDSYNRKR